MRSIDTVKRKGRRRRERERDRRDQKRKGEREKQGGRGRGHTSKTAREKGEEGEHTTSRGGEGRSLWFWSTGRVAVRGNNLRALMTNRVAVLPRQELASLRHVANACAAFAWPSTDLFTTCCRPIPRYSSRVSPWGGRGGGGGGERARGGVAGGIATPEKDSRDTVYRFVPILSKWMMVGTTLIDIFRVYTVVDFRAPQILRFLP